MHVEDFIIYVLAQSQEKSCYQPLGPAFPFQDYLSLQNVLDPTLSHAYWFRIYRFKTDATARQPHET